MRWLLPFLVACGADERPGSDKAPPPVDLGVCDAVEPTIIGVMNQITFGRADAAGISNGFDLDGTVTAPGGDDGCGIGDYVSPEGADGIDNAFSPIMTLLETTEAAAVEPLIQDTINSGALLLFFALEDVDDLENDGCVHLELVRGSGEPVVGNDRIVSNQTFVRDEATFVSRVDGVAIVDGTVLAGPLTLALPITIFDIELELVVQDARVRVDLLEDGTYWGFIAGGVVVDDIMAIALEENVNDEVSQLLDGVLDAFADLAPDESGECRQISVTLEFTGVSAFFFEE